MITMITMIKGIIDNGNSNRDDNSYDNDNDSNNLMITIIVARIKKIITLIAMKIKHNNTNVIHNT